MLTVKLLKYSVDDPATPGPAYLMSTCVRPAKAVHVRRELGLGSRSVMQLGDAPDDTVEVTIGDSTDCQFSVAYIMNEQGRTVETIR